MDRSFLASISIRVGGAVSNFILGLILARILGAEDLGRYAILLAFISLVGVPFSSGFPNFLTRELAAGKTAQQFEKINVLETFTTRLAVCFALIVAGVGILLQLSGIDIAGVPFSMLWIGMIVPLSGLDMLRAGIMRGLGSPLLSQLPENLARPTIMIVLLSPFLARGDKVDIATGLLCYSLSLLVSFALGRFLLRSLRKKSLPPLGGNRRPSFDAQVLRGVVSGVLTLSILGGISTLAGNIDMLVLNYYAAFGDAGAYRVALQGAALIVLGYNAVGAVSFVKVAPVISSGDRAAIRKVAREACLWQSGITLVAVIALAVFGRHVISALFGVEFVDAYLILLILSVGHLVCAFTGLSTMAVILSGWQGTGSIAALLSVSLTCILSVILYPSIGVIGVAVSSALGVSLRSMAFAVICRLSTGVSFSVIGLVSSR